MVHMGASEDDTLRPLSHDELLILLELYKKHLPFATSAYYFILNECHFRDFINKNQHYSLSDRLSNILYTHRHGDFARNGTFISVSKGKNFVSAVFTLEASLTELKECLWKSTSIAWNEGILLQAVHDVHKPLFLSHLKCKELTVTGEHPCACYLLCKEKAARFEYIAPKGYVLCILEPSNAEQIYELWPHKHEGTVVFVRELIEVNGGIGLFNEQNGDLVSWGIKNDYSGVGMLHTIESEQRQGFATIVLKALCKHIALMDQENVFAAALEKNFISDKLLSSTGFERVGRCTYIDFEK